MTPATGRETASPLRPVTLSPTCWAAGCSRPSRPRRPGRTPGPARSPPRCPPARPLAACLVQDCADVVDLLVYGRRGAAGNRIRQAHAPVVVHDEPAERRQPAHIPRQRRLHPRVVHVRVEPGPNQQQVRRPVTQHLVRQVDHAVARVAGLRRNTHTPIGMLACSAPAAGAEMVGPVRAGSGRDRN